MLTPFNQLVCMTKLLVVSHTIIFHAEKGWLEAAPRPALTVDAPWPVNLAKILPWSACTKVPPLVACSECVWYHV